MWHIIFAIVLVGLPSTAGGFLVARGQTIRDVTAGVTVLVYAAAVGLMYVFLLPEGRMVDARNGPNMTTAFFVGLVLGGLAGLIARSRDRNRG